MKGGGKAARRSKSLASRLAGRRPVRERKESLMVARMGVGGGRGSGGRKGKEAGSSLIGEGEGVAVGEGSREGEGRSGVGVTERGRGSGLFAGGTKVEVKGQQSSDFEMIFDPGVGVRVGVRVGLRVGLSDAPQTIESTGVAGEFRPCSV